MGQERLNSLLMIMPYVHKDFELDYNSVIDLYASHYQPLAAEYILCVICYFQIWYAKHVINSYL